MQSARQQQKTEEFRKAYSLRSGIEGTLSQAVRRCGLRRSRYVGEAKTHLNNLMIATSLNLMRMIAWLMEVPLAKTRGFSVSRISEKERVTGDRSDLMNSPTVSRFAVPHSANRHIINLTNWPFGR